MLSPVLVFVSNEELPSITSPSITTLSPDLNKIISLVAVSTIIGTVLPAEIINNNVSVAVCYEQLKLEKQLCFPLYAAAKEVVRKYKPYLDEIDLTYTQYITMMVLWDKEQCNVKELGSMLYLDSGTLTPLLKKPFRCPKKLSGVPDY